MIFFINFFFNFKIQYSFQNPATPLMVGIVDLHHTIMFYLTFILFFVFYLLGFTYNYSTLRGNRKSLRRLTQCVNLEIV